MKKILIALFIIVSAIGIATRTTTKKNTSKSKKKKKKVVTDPYVGWWYHESDENIYVDDQDGKLQQIFTIFF